MELAVLAINHFSKSSHVIFNCCTAVLSVITDQYHPRNLVPFIAWQITQQELSARITKGTENHYNLYLKGSSTNRLGHGHLVHAMTPLGGIEWNPYKPN